MSVSLTRFAWWYWSNGKEEKESKISCGSSSNSMKISSLNKKEKKVKKKWESREERIKIVNKEYDEDDVVLVSSDGYDDECCSYDSDWSIGWMEPHAPDFYQSHDDEHEEQDVNDASFAVLVPCYRNENCSKPFKMAKNNHFLNGNCFPAEGNKYMEQWIASLQNF